MGLPRLSWVGDVTIINKYLNYDIIFLKFYRNNIYIIKKPIIMRIFKKMIK